MRPGKYKSDKHPDPPAIEVPGAPDGSASWGKLTLEEKQKAMKKSRGNPNLRPGEYPYCVRKESFAQWMANNPDYKTKAPKKISVIIQKFLSEETTKSGNKLRSLQRGGAERLVWVLDALYRTAVQPQSKNQVIAAQLLLAYGYGKPSLSEDDQNAIKKGGLVTVYVNRPEIDPDIPKAQPALPAPQPEFIDAEFEDDNGLRQ